MIDPLLTIENVQLSNLNKVVRGSVNINSLPNKISQMKKLVEKYVDILVLSETKPNDSFPTSQFLVDAFSEPFRFDRNRSGGEVIIHARGDVPSKLLTKHFSPQYGSFCRAKF